MLGGHFGTLLRGQHLRLDRWGKMQHYSEPDRLYLDFDFQRPDRRSPRLRPFWTVLRMVGLRPLQTIMERTRHGWHVIIKINRELQPAETVALQSCLGSDGRREALNLMRVLAMRKKCYGVTPFWRARWNILYSSKL